MGLVHIRTAGNLVIECAWCNKHIGVKTSKPDSPNKKNVSHSICEACYRSVMKHVDCTNKKLGIDDLPDLLAKSK